MRGGWSGPARPGDGPRAKRLQSCVLRYSRGVLLTVLLLFVAGCGGDPLEPAPEPAIPIPFRDELLGRRAFQGLLVVIMLAGLGLVHLIGNWLERWRWRK